MLAARAAWSLRLTDGAPHPATCVAPAPDTGWGKRDSSASSGGGWGAAGAQGLTDLNPMVLLAAMPVAPHLGDQGKGSPGSWKHPSPCEAPARGGGGARAAAQPEPSTGLTSWSPRLYRLGGSCPALGLRVPAHGGGWAERLSVFPQVGGRGSPLRQRLTWSFGERACGVSHPKLSPPPPGSVPERPLGSGLQEALGGSVGTGQLQAPLRPLGTPS